MPWLLTLGDSARNAARGRRVQESFRNVSRILLLLAALWPVAVPAAVTNYTWVGQANPGRGSARWNRAGNWTNDPPPVNNVAGLTNVALIFQGRAKLAPVMQNNYHIRALIFASSAGAFALDSSGNQVLSLGAGGIVNQSVNEQTIASSLSLSNSQTWDAQAGNLRVENRVNLGTSTLTVAGPKDVAITGVVRGSGRILKQDAGELILGGAAPNTYSGGTTLDGGTLTVAKVNGLGTGWLTINSGILNLGTYDQTVGQLSVRGGTVNGTSGAITAAGYQVWSGAINARLAGGGGMIKSGSGLMNVTMPNTYSGGTVINGGTLAINNLTGSGTGSGFVAINNGGTLAGRGIISGLVTNHAGGTISPGFNLGQLSTGTEAWLGGSNFRWEIGDATAGAGLGWDLLNISGMLNILATAGNKAHLELVSFTLGGGPGAAANFDPAQSYLWKIAQTSGGITFPAGEDETSVFDLNTGGLAALFSGGTLRVTQSPDGRDLYLAYTPTPVPEPDKLALLALGACTYIYGRRLKRQWRGEQPPLGRARN